MKNVFSKILVVMALFLIAFYGLRPSEAFFDESLKAYAPDVSAGMDFQIRSSYVGPGKEVVFGILDPSGTLFEINSTSSQKGFAYAIVKSNDLQLAGKYSLGLRFKNSKYTGEISNFSVVPGQISQSKSILDPKNLVVQEDDRYFELTARILDDFGTPVSDREVALYSKHGELEVYEAVSKSDFAGEAKFLLERDYNGLVYFFIKLDSDKSLPALTSRVLFPSSNERLSVALINEASFEPKYAASLPMGNSSGPVDRLKFENIPSAIAAGAPISFSVTAYDSLDQKVVNYLGKVRFSILGPNSDKVSLPEDYQFTVADQGSHTFSLAANFQEPGKYIVEVRDLTTTSIFVAQEFTVGAPGSSSNPANPVDQNATVNLTNLLAGTFTNAIQVISGTAPPGARLKIFDNQVELASLIADVNGAFSYTTSPLLEGSHTIYVSTVNDQGQVVDSSSEVQITIDTSAAKISKIELTPGGPIEAGSSFTAKLIASDSIAQASVILADNVYPLNAVDNKTFEASVPAPSTIGTYSLSFLVIDDLGNQARYDDQGSIQVVTASSTPNPTGDQVINGGKVPTVMGLTAIPGDSRVTLRWLKVESSASAIKHYRIFYGTEPTKYTTAVDTLTADNTWYISGLKNGQTYYFAIAAVDSVGNMSSTLSQVVSMAPGELIKDVVSPDIAQGAAGGDALTDKDNEVNASGPNWLYILIISFVGYYLLRFCKFAVRTK